MDKINHKSMSSDNQSVAQLLSNYLEQQQYLQRVDIDDNHYVDEREQNSSQSLSQDEMLEWLDVEQYR